MGERCPTCDSDDRGERLPLITSYKPDRTKPCPDLFHSPERCPTCDGPQDEPQSQRVGSGFARCIDPFHISLDSIGRDVREK